MAFSMKSNENPSQSRQTNSACKNRKSPNSQNYLKTPECHGSRSASVDVLILIVVMGASGVLLFPGVKLICLKSAESFETFATLVSEEVSDAPMIYTSLAISLVSVVIAALVIVIWTGNRCSKPNVQGLRNAVEFDIQLETEKCMKYSSLLMKGEGKKIAPPNGRAVLVFRENCGCSVGVLQVPGSKRRRKIKK